MWLLLYCACFTPAVTANYPPLGPLRNLLINCLVTAQPYSGAFRRHVRLLVIDLQGFNALVVFWIHHFEVIELLPVHVRAADAAAFAGVVQTDFLDSLRLFLTNPPINKREYLAPLIFWLPVLDAVCLVGIDADDSKDGASVS